MMHLWNLVDDICRELFSEWLEVNALGFLDSAMCNIQKRLWFLSQLQAIKSIPLYNNLDLFYPSVSVYKWIQCRSLHISTLMPLPYHDEVQSLHSYFVLSEIKELVFKRFRDQSAELSDLANACTSLVSLQCDDPIVFPLVSTDILVQLTSLNCDTVNTNCLWEDLMAALVVIERNCKVLQQFSFTADHYSGKLFAQIRSIVAQNQGIESLVLVFDDTIFDVLLSHCPKLTSFELTITKSLFPLRQACQLIKDRKLRYFQCVHRRKFEQLTYRCQNQRASVELYNFEEVIPELEDALSDLHLLTQLTISFCAVTDGMMQALLDNCGSTLESIDLRCCKLQTSPLIFSKFRALNSFALELCNIAPEDLLAMLCSEPFPSLKVLSVAENALKITTVVQLLSVYPFLLKCGFHRVTDNTPLHPEAKEQVKQLMRAVPDCEVRFGWNKGLSCLIHRDGEYWTEYAQDFD